MPLALVPKPNDIFIASKLFPAIDRHAGKEAAPKPWTETTRIDALDYDSLARVELAMDLEDEFDTTFPDQAIENCETIGEVLKLVAERLA